MTVDRPVIFLDFDGVLNSQEYMEKRGGRDEIGARLDRQAVDRLNSIVDATGAAVVVSSSWRNGRSVDELQHILDEHGFGGDVIDKTRPRDSNGEDRGEVIAEWLDEHPEVDDYVAIDDSWLMGVLPDERFVHTDFTVGLTRADTREAIRILTEDA